LVGALFPVLALSSPVGPLQKIGYVRGENGRLYEAFLLSPSKSGHQLAAPRMNGQLELIQEPLDMEDEEPVSDYMRPMYPLPDIKGKAKKNGKSEYDEWILSNLG